MIFLSTPMKNWQLVLMWRNGHHNSPRIWRSRVRLYLDILTHRANTVHKSFFLTILYNISNNRYSISFTDCRGRFFNRFENQNFFEFLIFNNYSTIIQLRRVHTLTGSEMEIHYIYVHTTGPNICSDKHFLPKVTPLMVPNARATSPL
jgi:hypothetical protein